MMHDLFNDKADEFVRDLVSAFPTIAEFRQLKSALTLLRSVDPKRPQIIFDSAVLTRYRDTILARDDAAFQNIQLQELSDPEQRNAWLPFVDRLKGMWGALSRDDRDAVWKHFFVLLTVSDRIKKTAVDRVSSSSSSASSRVASVRV